MTPHSPTPLEKPVSIGSGSEKTWDAWLAVAESLLLDLDSVDSFVIRSAFFNVKRSFFGIKQVLDS